MGVPFLLAYKEVALHEMLHILLADYLPFIILLWSLYTVSGGILLRGTLRGTPLVNSLMLVLGTALASWMGTTGASMLLIRPFLRANSYRKNRAFMVVFFIFLVANVGGCLTPLGDPPLFLGFLHGVPFFWTLRLIPEMLAMTIFLLSMLSYMHIVQAGELYRWQDATGKVRYSDKIPPPGAKNVTKLKSSSGGGSRQQRRSGR